MDTTLPPALGLSSSEAHRRLAQYGENIIYRKKKLRPIVAFLQKFNSPLLLLLIGTAIVSFFLGEHTSAGIILTMVCLSAVLDFVNTRKSEAVAEALEEKVATTATVWRDGAKCEIPVRAIVPGDVLSLIAGNIIPADGIVLDADDLFVNQSSLTGESFPVEKRASTTPDSDHWALDSSSSVAMGTSVVTGFATVRVMTTGAATSFGTIAAHLASAEPETNFERGIRDFSMLIVRLTFVMVMVVFAVNTGMHRGVLNSFLFSVAIAVGLTPELLPVIMSVAMARGSLAMAKKEVIVKNLSSIQNFGAMDILCTDKTGTLTEDRITLVRCVNTEGADSPDVLALAVVSSSYHTGKESPLDTAIRAHGGIDLASYTKVDEIPFDFHRRRDSIVADTADARLLIAKGAPESVLSVSTHIRVGTTDRPLSPLDKEAIEKLYDTLSQDGFRVLGLAVRTLPKDSQQNYEPTDEAGMAFLGFAAFLDPPKESASLALKDLAAFSIELKIVTGDSELLTEKVCRTLDLPVKGMLLGSEVDTLSDEELGLRAEETTIFARVSPEQKERIVTALRARGHVVGYMGDGINDAPVLKAADVGISVANAVDVAKETADIVLLTKSLAVLKDGVIEGRTTFRNTVKYIKMGFSSNFGNMFSMMGASAFLPFLPMLPTQILLNNFLYDISQTTISADRTDPEDTRVPLKWDMRSFTRYIVVFGLVSSIFDALTFVLLFRVLRLPEAGFQTGWFIESIATQILIVYVIRTHRLPFFRSMPAHALIFSTLGVVSLAWALPMLPIGSIFGFVPLSLPTLGAIAGIVGCYLLIGEGAKALFYRRWPHAA